MISFIFRDLLCFWRKPQFQAFQCDSSVEFSNILKALYQDPEEKTRSIDMTKKRGYFIPVLETKSNWIVRLFRAVIWSKETTDFKKTAKLINDFVIVNRHLLQSSLKNPEEFKALQQLHARYYSAKETRKTLENYMQSLEQANSDAFQKADGIITEHGSLEQQKACLEEQKRRNTQELEETRQRQEREFQQRQQAAESGLREQMTLLEGKRKRNIQELEQLREQQERQLQQRQHAMEKAIQNKEKEAMLSIAKTEQASKERIQELQGKIQNAYLQYEALREQLFNKGVAQAQIISEARKKADGIIKEAEDQAKAKKSQVQKEIEDYNDSQRRQIIGIRDKTVDFRHLRQDPAKQDLCFIAKDGQKLFANSQFFALCGFIQNGFRNANNTQATVKSHAVVEGIDLPKDIPVKDTEGGIERVRIDLSLYSPEAVEAFINYYYGAPWTEIRTEVIGELHQLAHEMSEAKPQNISWKTLLECCEEAIFDSLEDSKDYLEWLINPAYSLAFKYKLASRLAARFHAIESKPEFTSLPEQDQLLILNQANISFSGWEMALKWIDKIPNSSFKEKAAAVIAPHFRDFLKSGGEAKLSRESLYAIFDSPMLKIASEEEVAAQLFAIAFKKFPNDLERMQFLNEPLSDKDSRSLLDTVRFHLMPSERRRSFLTSSNGKWLREDRLAAWSAFAPPNNEEEKAKASPLIRDTLNKERYPGIEVSVEVQADGSALFYYWFDASFLNSYTYFGTHSIEAKSASVFIEGIGKIGFSLKAIWGGGGYNRFNHTQWKLMLRPEEVDMAALNKLQLSATYQKKGRGYSGFEPKEDIPLKWVQNEEFIKEFKSTGQIALTHANEEATPFVLEHKDINSYCDQVNCNYYFCIKTTLKPIS